MPQAARRKTGLKMFRRKSFQTLAIVLLSTSLAGASPIAIAGMKRAMQVSERNDLRAQLELEARHQVECFLSEESAEGMSAFFEKKPRSG